MPAKPNAPDTHLKLDREALGMAVRLFREASGLNQLALAQLAGLSQPTLSKVERGDTFSDETLNKLAEALEVSTQEVLDASFELQKPDSVIHAGLAAWTEAKSMLKAALLEKEVRASVRPFRLGAEVATRHIPAARPELGLTAIVKAVEPLRDSATPR